MRCGQLQEGRLLRRYQRFKENPDSSLVQVQASSR